MSFAKKLSENLLNSEGKQFINLGTCSLHPVHTAFKCGLDTLSLTLNNYLMREDYKKIGAFTKVTAELAKKFGERR